MKTAQRRFGKRWTIERAVTTFKIFSGGQTFFINYDHDTKSWHVWDSQFNLIGQEKTIRECKGKENVTFTRAKFIFKQKINHGKKGINKIVFKGSR